MFQSSPPLPPDGRRSLIRWAISVGDSGSAISPMWMVFTSATSEVVVGHAACRFFFWVSGCRGGSHRVVACPSWSRVAATSALGEVRDEVDRDGDQDRAEEVRQE